LWLVQDIEKVDTYAEAVDVDTGLTDIDVGQGDFVRGKWNIR
jgi:hypothetical protein